MQNFLIQTTRSLTVSSDQPSENSNNSNTYVVANDPMILEEEYLLLEENVNEIEVQTISCNSLLLTSSCSRILKENNNIVLRSTAKNISSSATSNRKQYPVT